MNMGFGFACGTFATLPEERLEIKLHKRNRCSKMGAAASLHNNLEAHVKNMDAKELARFARENKINTYVTEIIKFHDIDGNTAMALENDDLGDMAPKSKLNKKKLIVALSL